MFKWFFEIFDCETKNKYCKEIKKSSDKYFYIINAMTDAQKSLKILKNIYRKLLERLNNTRQEMSLMGWR